MDLLLALQTSLDPEQLLQRLFAHFEAHFGIEGLKAALPQMSPSSQQLGNMARFQSELSFRQEGGDGISITLARSTAFSEQEQRHLEEHGGLVFFPLRNALLYQKALLKARQDDLTGLFNRAALRETVERELSLAHRYNQPLALVMLDVDDFKGVNDEYGHSLGDQILRELADTLRQCARCGDLLFRYAGDEFLVLSSHTDTEGATALAERIHAKTSQITIERHGRVVRARVSVGVAEAEAGDDFERFFERVDQALYRAKHAGRNRIVAADQ